ncbi:MAG: hypothetical protein LCH56_09300 [Proteobacteria bacterium]|nr:hypothetical protein [Pseudomonadota bacterium]
MTSNDIFPQRLTRIDDLTRSDHFYLDDEDVCLFIGEYTARQGFSFSATNQLILNFKKTMDRRGTPQWKYKGQAIRQAATALRQSLSDENLARLTFVPIPPSKAKTDPLYDDRLVKTLHAIRPNPPLDIRELIVQKVSTAAVHSVEDRPSPDAIAANYEIDVSLIAPPPQVICLFDDVLTTGAHFKACEKVLRQTYPQVPIIGIFIARRAPEAVDFDPIPPDVDF